MRKISVAFLTILLVSSLCSLPLAAQGKGSILLASEKTRFKDALITELESLFTLSGYMVQKAQHTKGGLDAYKASDYAAVFITNSGVYSKVRPWVTAWIEKNRASGAYILLHTTQIKDWKVEATVDAVTSASTNDGVKALAREYYSKITAELDKKDLAQ